MVRELQFCRLVKDRVILRLSPSDIDRMKAFKCIEEALLVAKECIDNATNAWLFIGETQEPNRKGIKQLVPGKLSRETANLMIEGYRKRANRDLAIARDFAQVESELDNSGDT